MTARTRSLAAHLALGLGSLAAGGCVDTEWRLELDAGLEADAGIGRDAAEPGGSDASGLADLGAPDAAGPADLGASDGGPLLEVAAPRELRGLWLTTVYGLDFPSRSGLDAGALRAELEAWVEVAARAGVNALFFQVRPESDAVYVSPLEPSSRFVADAPGGPLPLDPLATLIELARARAIEVHAWVNPYRAQVDARRSVPETHVSRRLPAHAHRYGDALWMDPGAPEVRAHVLAVIRDLLTRYDLDGLHFDDYFYPYPRAGEPFPDDASWRAYRDAGGPIADRADWRRSNVDALVREVHALVRDRAPWVRFGISPFGIYRPGQPAGITGLDQYDALYADPLEWARNGWVDYLAPQLYWPTTQTAQAFEPLLRWWRAEAPVPVFPGLFLSKVGTEPAWSLQEILTQLNLTRTLDPQGFLLFRAAALADDQAGAASALARDYAGLAVPPALPRPRPAAAPPRREGRRWRAETPETVRAWLVYRVDAAGSPTLESIHPPGAPPALPEDGVERAVSVLTRGGVESLARVAGR